MYNKKDMKKKYYILFLYILVFLGDTILVYFSFLTAYNARFFWPWIIKIFPVTKGFPPWEYYQQFLNLTIAIWMTVFVYNRLYKKKFLPALDELLLIFKSVSIAIALTMAITFIYRRYEFSRLVIGFSWITGTFFIYLWHEISKYVYQQIFRGKTNVLIIGKSKDMNFIKSIIQKHKHIRSYFIVEQKTSKDIIEFVKKKNLEEIFLLSNFLNEKDLLYLVNECENLEIDLKIIPDILQLRQGEIIVDDSLNLPIFHIKPVSLHGYNFYFKVIFDCFIAIGILSLLIVPLLFISIMIKLDSKGPVFYTHKRMGRQSKIFNFYKFRSMVEDADKLLQNLLHMSERPGHVFKMKYDPRITKVGRILRKYSLDEIPQLFNVLKGNMSLVGPRPQVLWEADFYDDFSKRRLRVLPGITGLWQISGRAELSFEQMIELDIYYIENWSAGLDIKILLKTTPVLFSKKGAY